MTGDRTRNKIMLETEHRWCCSCHFLCSFTFCCCICIDILIIFVRYINLIFFWYLAILAMNCYNMRGKVFCERFVNKWAPPWQTTVSITCWLKRKWIQQLILFSFLSASAHIMADTTFRIHSYAYHVPEFCPSKWQKTKLSLTPCILPMIPQQNKQQQTETEFQIHKTENILTKLPGVHIPLKLCASREIINVSRSTSRPGPRYRTAPNLCRRLDIICQILTQ